MRYMLLTYNAHSGSVEIRPVMEDELADRIAEAGAVGPK
jgi:hypothetical protein